MMSDVIAELDAALEESGEDVVLRRVVGTGNAVNIDVTIRANVRSARTPDQLAAGVYQDDIRVIASPTQIRDAQWPGGVATRPAPFNPDQSLPRRGDFLIVKGRKFHVEVVDAISVRGHVVRIVMTAKGNSAT